ncbi:MAG: tryptophan synthase subunit alpha [Kiritimatiellae bacterium]|nr:tryptophan synthase subunit alpha [Kiritimatiellia bacterium]
MGRIGKAFDGRKAFVAFITCGDPDLETTAAAVREMAAAGAGVIELGIPFSDPTAEGPVIQGANARALAGGVTTDKIFDMVALLRREIDTPLAFMTYANVVFSRTIAGFAAKCAEVGIDGLILPDVPFEEKEGFAPEFRRRGIDFISLVAPTSGERVAKIAREAEGFLYIVSSLGVTGARSEITTDLASIVATVRENTPIPCAVGFGISTPEQAAQMAALSDGAIVGSAIVRLMAEHGRAAPKFVGDYVRGMADAVRMAAR